MGGPDHYADKHILEQADGMRAVPRDIVDDIFRCASFGAGEFVDESGQRQLGPVDQLVGGRSSEQLADGHDHELRLQSRRYQSHDAN